MRIAVVTRFLRSPLEGVGQHTYEILNLLIQNHPEIEWHLINDGQPGQITWTQENVHHHKLGPATRHPILWYLWYEWRLPKLLNKLNIDSIWYPDGFMSLTSNFPSLLTIHDLAYLKFPEGSIQSHRKFLEHKMPLQIQKANSIACVSNFIKEEVIHIFKCDEERIILTPNAPSSQFKALSPPEIVSFRKEHTFSKPYFIYLGSIHPRKNIINLIGAFEAFKKNTTLPHLLILAGRWAWKSDVIRKQLETSSVRDSILLIEQGLDEIRYDLVGAASAMVYVSHYEGFGMPVIESLACGVPVVSSKNSVMEKVAGNDGIYVNANDPYDIARGMKASQESPRGSDSKIQRAESFLWEDSAGVVFNQLFELGKK